ncbi:hypothetical protein [Haloferula sp. BvORR071]|uniref:hypothetical protein n=1 Tax=Haloferula sp. BvORR071 TaxID=1396141 RepID=UPI002240F094|nr:hypothetical protein [Haloferula sp. BvORR071]
MAILVVLAGVSPFFVIGWFWPEALGPAWCGTMLVLILALIIGSLLEGRRLLRQIGSTTGEIVPGRLVEARGIYLYGFEAGWIMVATGRKTLGIFPRFEKWQAIDLGELLPTGEADTTRSWRSYVLRFTGIPSETGNFGHMGGCRRTIEIREVLGIEAEAAKRKDLPMAGPRPISP